MPISRGSKRARYVHKRLKSPKLFDKRSFRTITRGRKKFVVACLKGEWKHGRCKVGMQRQAVLTLKKGR